MYASPVGLWMGFTEDRVKIIRVFPHKTSFTPDDDMVFIGLPPGLFIPKHDEVHISCTFTWDMEYSEHLLYQWTAYTDKPVKLGGVAYRRNLDPAFTPGLYVKKGIIFTSRGCNNSCQHCFVSKTEGKIRELPITEGNIIQDNNFLQCSTAHKNRVFEMLKTQKGICFKGGLQADLIDEHFIENIKQLSIKELFVACDHDDAIPLAWQAIKKLTAAGYTRNHIRCYVLIGDDMKANEKRLQLMYQAGAMPFAQLYQPPGNTRLEYSKEWRQFCRQWSRSAAIKAHCEKGTKFEDYNT